MEHERCPNPGCGSLLEPFQVPITGLPQMVSLTAWWCEKCHAPVRWHAPHPIAQAWEVCNWHAPETDLDAQAWELLEHIVATCRCSKTDRARALLAELEKRDADLH